MFPILNRKLTELSIRYKIVAACTALFVPFALLAGIFSYSLMRSTLEDQIERELRNATEATRNMVQTSVRLSIRNYLRAVSETNADIVASFYARQQRGELGEEEAKRMAAQTLLQQQIAQSGYVYCLDSSGVVTVHREPGVLGQRLKDIPFIQEQMTRKNGYVEYDWRNPDEVEPRPKALWMTHFAPWDWIISATAYREEFDQVVNIDDFRPGINAVRFLDNGYSYVMNGRGDLIVHPSLEGANVFERGLETPGELFRTMLVQKKGRLAYEWQNPGEERLHRKMVVFDHIPEVDWYVASSAYLEDLYRPVKASRNLSILIALICTLGGGVVVLRISSTITTPLQQLAGRFAQGATGDYSIRMAHQGGDEIGQLATFFNRFMEQLDTETRERKRLERLIIEADDQERLRVGQELHDDLAPHLIGSEVMCRILERRLGTRVPEIVPQAEQVRELIVEAIAKTRTLARGLCPLHLGEGGLLFALREFATRITTLFQVPCEVRGPDAPPIPEGTAIHLYRIAQEAVQNAVKHAAATKVDLLLTPSGDDLLLEVADDGRGFDPGRKEEGMGLSIMQYRAKIIGAAFAVESHPEQGTVVRVLLPDAMKFEGEGNAES